MKYALVGYDKDNDIYEVIAELEDLESLKLIGKGIAEIQKEINCFRKNGDGEPFDWFEIVDTDNTEYPDVYYWVSYED